ncbi:MAG: response regulator transcription factor [Anaerolinea sp.]|nr:response regulator transcription factor [Anaerolinea sp.]
MSAAVEAAIQGLFTLDSIAVEALISTTLPAVTGERTPDALTPREIEVLRLIAEGLPNKQIAIKLSISEHTVKFHVNAILTKLGAQSRTEAVVRATRLGWIAL